MNSVDKMFSLEDPLSAKSNQGENELIRDYWLIDFCSGNCEDCQVEVNQEIVDFAVSQVFGNHKT